jgi:geranylgeranyl diphosphate synthase type I
MNLSPVFRRLLPRIEAELHDIVHIPHDGLATYYGMMHYHLGWADELMQPAQEVNSGKRLRPLLCLLACEAAGGAFEQALPAAGALELIHNFSLVHDDIQDRSRYRRGRRAVWDLWGTAHGINVGDGLFVLARLALHRLDSRHVPLDRIQAAALAFDRACLALCEGQFFDLAFEERVDVHIDQYLQMIHHKTAALLAASAQIGTILATDEKETVNHSYRFGECLGMAFQIQDDVLGSWGDQQLTGKSAATDIRHKKKTLPIVYVLNLPGEQTAVNQLLHLYSQKEPLDEEAIETTLSILEETGARQYAEGMAKNYYNEALTSLAHMGADSAALSQLGDLAASLLGRKA